MLRPVVVGPFERLLLWVAWCWAASADARDAVYLAD
jgi:hypothetical protein